MKRLLNKNIYLIVTGAPKARYAKRMILELISEGANVYTVPTKSALNFVDIDELRGIKGNTVKTDWGDKISIPKEDIVLIAPCTFNTLNAISSGLANSYPLCIIASAIGHGSPVFCAPSMNKSLWDHPCVKENIIKLENWNCRIIWPQISGTKVTMTDVGKILDTVYFSNHRVNYIPIRKSNKTETSKLNTFREKYFDLFKEVGDFLLKGGMNLPTAGCLSVKVPGGFLITSTGCDISDLKMDNLVFVCDFDEVNNKVYWVGKNVPSSESPLHCVIHQNIKDQIVLHFHCPKITYSPNLSRYRSVRYLRYGSFKIGYKILADLKKQSFFIMKYHGEVMTSENVELLKTIITNMYLQS